MEFNFKANQVHCNGIGGYGYQPANKYLTAIKAVVNEVLATMTLDELYEKASAASDGPCHPGTRFKDSDAIAARLVTGIGNYIWPKFENDAMTEMYVGALLQRLTAAEKLTMVVDAARDCAEADHWYTFEKEWN